MEEIKKFAQKARLITLEAIYKSKSSHIGSCFSMIDILSILYCKILNIDPNNPLSPQRDRFLLSKGHACAGLYAVLALKDFFDSQEFVSQYTADGTFFTSHANYKLNGVELSTGSLGHALSVGCGIALAAKRKKKSFKTIVLLSDGELNEGSNWESILFAPHHRLDNLTVIIDYNKLQGLGTTSDILSLDSLSEKFKSFGWHVEEVDGHDFKALDKIFSSLPYKRGKPTVVIAHTIKGKGVPFMEKQLLWHYRCPSDEEYVRSKEILNRNL